MEAAAHVWAPLPCSPLAALLSTGLAWEYGTVRTTGVTPLG